MQLIFDVLHLYYLPQYLPVYHQLLKQQAGTATFVFYRGIHDSVIENIIAQQELSHIWVDNEQQAVQYYLQQKAHWVIFANDFSKLKQIHQVSKSVQLGHGIGPKSSYYTKSSTPTSVRFVEGNYRTERLRVMFPQDNFVNVGFCKLDPLLNNNAQAIVLEDKGLDSNKKTLLYAPTFYPSSIERFAKNWPSEFANYNILLKPHYFSVSKEKYQKQLKLLNHWATFDNVYLAEVEDYSLVPFMAAADLLISDASSALFEFAAINKPVIWCDFLKLRWSYRGPLNFRFQQRIDQDYGEYAQIAVHAKSYRQLLTMVKQQIDQPNSLEKIRLAFADKLAGALDGKASERIVNYLVKNC